VGCIEGIDADQLRGGQQADRRCNCCRAAAVSGSPAGVRSEGRDRAVRSIDVAPERTGAVNTYESTDKGRVIDVAERGSTQGFRVGLLRCVSLSGGIDVVG